MATWDGIILGGGPNGLTVAAYMARAGLNVLVLERRMEIGGGLATEKVTIPGWIHNTHAVYHMMVDYAPVFQDLELFSRYKLDFVQPELSWVIDRGTGVIEPTINNKFRCVVAKGSGTEWRPGRPRSPKAPMPNRRTPTSSTSY